MVGCVYLTRQNHQEASITPKAQDTNLDVQAWTDFVEAKISTSDASQKTLSIIFIGDVSFSRGVGQMIKLQKSANYPFAKTVGYLKNADLTIANLETPITEGRDIQNGEMVFRSNPGTEDALKWAGIDIVNLANNHTPDFEEIGIKDTIEYLTNAGIKFMGAGESLNQAIEPLIIEKNSIKIAFVSFTDPSLVSPKYEATETSAGTAFMKLDLLKTTITKAKNQADFVIVSMHSGTEYELEPNNTQVTFAQSAIDYGADIVIGHHPHVIEPIRQYKGKYIIYSLGNYILDQMWSQETREGLIAKIIITEKGVESIAFNTTQIENYSQPRIIYTDQNTKPLARLQTNLNIQPTAYWDESNKKYALGDQKFIGNDNALAASSSIQTEDLNKDRTVETYELKVGQLTITSNNKTVWQSPTTWWIDSFRLADVNNDGTADINMSVWKQGSFDKYLPIWQNQNDMSIKNHFFVFDLNEKLEVHPVWQSSNLAKPNCNFDIYDINNDGKNELITQEGDYLEDYSCKTTNYGVWNWDQFGFTNIWNSNIQ